MASSIDVSDTPYWIKFFTDAGIPAGEAANHAVTFTDHRIHKDMLMDLSKEYLNDMDISKMGDVIAILRHAKVVHTKLNNFLSAVVQNARDRALETASKCTRDRALETASTCTRDRALETASKCTRDRALETASKCTRDRALETASKCIPAAKKASPVPRRSTAASRMVEHYIGGDVSASPISKPPSPKLSASISARLGNTGKSSVFERLGSEVTVTEVGDIIVKSSQQPSVFNRLGDKKTVKRPATSTSDVAASGLALEYGGILKSVPTKKTKVSKLTITKKAAESKKTETMAVDDSMRTLGILSPRARCEQLSLNDRLGKKVEAGMVSSTTGSPAISENKLTITKKSLNARLGPQITSTAMFKEKTNSKEGVFGRLGKKI